MERERVKRLKVRKSQDDDTDDKEPGKIHSSDEYPSGAPERSDSSPPSISSASVMGSDADTDDEKKCAQEEAKPELENRLDYETHPLENKVILKTIFDLCSLSDLKNCRRVCRKWLNASLDTWRSNAVLRCKESRYDSGGLDQSTFDKIFCPTPEQLEMEEEEEDEAIKKIKESVQETPFKSYCFSVTTRDMPVQIYRPVLVNENIPESFQFPAVTENIPELSRSLSGVGLDNVKFLKLEKFSGQFETLIREIFDKLRKLEHLFLKRPVIYSARSNPDDLITRPYYSVKHLTLLEPYLEPRLPLRQLLGKIPNLKSLRIGCNQFPQTEAIHTISPAIHVLAAVRDIRALGGLRNLKTLDLFEPTFVSLILIPQHIADLIKEARLPLTRLSVYFGTQTEPAVIQKFFESHMNTLEYLRTTCTPVARIATMESMIASPPLGFSVRMENLKDLRISSALTWGLQILGSLVLPNLYRLIMEDDLTLQGHDFDHEPSVIVNHIDTNFLMVDRDREKFVRGMERVSLPSLEIFEFQPTQRLLGKTILKLFAKAMPNLRQLTMPLNARTFRTVCKYWPSLKVLTVTEGEGDYDEITDCAITGLEEGENPKFTPNRPPNITNLVELTDLVIPFRKACKRKEIKLTDRSAIHGFLKLPKLSRLRVAFKEISDATKEALAKHVTYLEIGTYDETELPSDLECFSEDDSYSEMEDEEMEHEYGNTSSSVSAQYGSGESSGEESVRNEESEEEEHEQNNMDE